MKDEVPSVFGYTNYRKYLSDYYEARKNSSRGYSYRQFGLKAGFSSPNALKNVIEGSRKLTPQSIAQFSQALGLESTEADYFRTLVLMNQAELDADKERYFQELQLHMPMAKRYELQADAMEYVQHWLYPVIRELIQSKGFRDDPYWIKRRLTSDVELHEIARALNFLKSKGFIYLNEEKKYVSKDDVIISSDEVRSMAIRGYYRKVVEQAAGMVDKIPVEQREYGALIFNISEKRVPELKDIMKKFINDLHKWSLDKSDDDGKVIQFLFQMYPQTKLPSADVSEE